MFILHLYSYTATCFVLIYFHYPKRKVLIKPTLQINHGVIYISLWSWCFIIKNWKILLEVYLKLKRHNQTDVDPVILNQGQFWHLPQPPWTFIMCRNISDWQLGKGSDNWHLVGRGQTCWLNILQCIQDSPPEQWIIWPKVSLVSYSRIIRVSDFPTVSLSP